MVYKGRIDLDNCDIIPLEDGKGNLNAFVLKIVNY